MKKKILFGAVIAAMALSFVACKKIGDIQWSDKGSGTGTKIVKVEQKNENDHTIRGMKQLDLIPRHQATCVVQQFNQTNKTCDGMVGFVTYYSENKKDATAANYGTINFLVVGVRNNCGQTETYASYYCNIDKTKLSTQNFGCSQTKEKYDATATEPYEVIIVDLPGTGKHPNEGILNTKYDSDGTLKVAIEFMGKTDGSIEITWYDEWTEPPASQASAQIDFTNHKYLMMATAEAEQIGNEVDPTEKAKKGTVWAYANIYADKTLKGQWNLYNVSMAAATNADEEGELIETGDIFFQEF